MLHLDPKLLLPLKDSGALKDPLSSVPMSPAYR